MDYPPPLPSFEKAIVTEDYLSMRISVYLPLIHDEEALQEEADRLFSTVRKNCLHECNKFAEENRNGEVDMVDEQDVGIPVHEINEDLIFKGTEDCILHPTLLVDDMYEEADRVFGSMKANVLAKYRKWAWHKEIQRAYSTTCKAEDHDVAEPEYQVFKFYPTFTFGEFDYEEAFEACLKERMGQVAGHLHYDYITWRETGTAGERCINNISEALAADITMEEEDQIRGDPCFNVFRACILLRFERDDDDDVNVDFRTKMTVLETEVRKKYISWKSALPPRPYVARNVSKFALVFFRTHGGRESVPIWYTYP